MSLPNKPADPLSLSNMAAKLRLGNCFRAISVPIHSLADQHLMGYEMLSRGPAGTLEMPDDFFRFSIENNILKEVDLNCFRTCLAATLQIQLPCRFHLNLFPSTISDTSLESLLTLFPAQAQPGMFCLEIIEQQLMYTSETLYFQVHALKEAGILIALDDVGFGASSLEALIALEPDIIKIDRRYVTNVASDTKKEYALRRLVKIAGALECELVAEGVDYLPDLELLKELGVHYGQGRLWGNSIP